MEINKVFIAGAGLMGSGIAQVCAQAGLEVILCDIGPEVLEKATKNIAWSAGKLIEKGKAAGPLEAVMGRIVTTTDYGRAAEADLVSRPSSKSWKSSRRFSPDLTPRPGRRPCWPPIPAPSASAPWRPGLGGPRRSWVCTSSARPP